MSESIQPWTDPKENAPVPRWEVRQMIKECVVTEIGTYERTIVAPRHMENQLALSKLTNTIDKLSDTFKELNGGVKVLKLLGVLLTGTVGLGGGIYAVARLFGHS